MSKPQTAGIRDPDRATHWLVPPWDAGATFCEVVRHFLMHQPHDSTNRAHMRAYFVGYQAALEAAPIETHLALDADWYENMLGCITRCAACY